MRLFVAINPDDAALRHLDTALAPRRADASLAQIRWVPWNRWHLTLAFIGDVDPEAVDPLADALREGLAQLPPMEQVHCQGAGTFGGRLLWVGLASEDQGRPALQPLARAVRRIVRQTRLPVDDQRWRPHLTVARDRLGGQAPAAADAMSGYVGPTWQPGPVLVMSSILGPQPQHVIEATVRMA